MHIAIVGAGDPRSEDEAAAETIGRAVAEGGATVVCGGLGGVMAAACRGARSVGGLTVGLLPGTDRAAANAWVVVAVPTGLGELRNGLVVRASDVVVAVGGEHGTLSEVAFALKVGVPVVGLHTWTLTRGDGTVDAAVHRVDDPGAAAALALELAGAAT